MKINIGNISSGNNTNISINNMIDIQELKEEISKDSLSKEEQIELKNLIKNLNDAIENKNIKDVNYIFNNIKTLGKEVTKAISTRLVLLGLNLV